jgi:hypothetical protein
MKEVKAYKCDYCRKVSLNKLTYHERFCRNNPNNKHVCYDCKHLEVSRESIITGFEEGYSIKTFNCKKYNKSMFTYKAERRKLNIEKLERMPVECIHYEFNHDFDNF